MKNRKLKHAIENIQLETLFVENARNICRILIVLNECCKFSPAKLQEWMEDMHSTSDQFNEYERAGVFDFKVDTLAKASGVDFNDCVDIVKRNSKYKWNADITAKLAQNVQIALIMTCTDFGIGKVRLNRIMDRLLNMEITDPFSECDKKFNISVENNKYIDYATEIIKSKSDQRKLDRSDSEQKAVEISEGLKAFKLITESDALKGGVKNDM